MDPDCLGNGIPFLAMKALRWLIPGTIRARLLLLVLGAVLAAQAATLYTVSVYQRNHAQTVAVDLIATTIRTLQTAMSGIAPQDRAEFVQRTSLGQWRLWSRPLPAGARMHRMPKGAGSPQSMQSKPHASMPGGASGQSLPNSQDELRRSLRGLVANLNTRLGNDTRVAMSRGPHPELYLSLPTNEPDALPREWLVIPIDRIDPPFTTATIVWWSAGIALILLMAAGFSWHIAGRSPDLPKQPISWHQAPTSVSPPPGRTRRAGLVKALTPCLMRSRNLIKSEEHCWLACRTT